MTTRNPMNERYNDDTKPAGKTRKSASSAKPKTAAATTVREAPAKTKKQKKKEREQREAAYREKRGMKPDQSNYLYSPELAKTDEYKRLRRRWGVAIGIGVAMTILAWVFAMNESLGPYSWPLLVVAYAAIIYAFYLDWSKIRKLRKSFDSVKQGKSKEARAQQKELHAAAIEERRKAAEAAANGEAVEETKKSKINLPQKFRNFLARL